MKRELIILIVFTFVGAALGAHELVDPDLGWNVAGGIWILKNCWVPTADPFLSPSAEWIDYCWLPQLLFAAIFKFAGFKGLYAAQIFFSGVVTALGVYLLTGAAKENKYLALVKAALLILFVSPVFHLRPQLLSLFLFELFLVWRRSQGQSIYQLIILLMIWVNTHVYWVFAPAILGLDWLVARDRKTFCLILVSALGGLLSPYLIRNYYPIVEYSFFHSHVKGLIREFQSLFTLGGYLLVATFFTLGVFLYERSKVVKELLSGVGLFALACWQMKFCPLFGVYALKSEGNAALRSALIRVILTLLPISVVASVVSNSVIGEEQKEWLELGGRLVQVPGPVLNSFDTGGWIELGEMLVNDEMPTKLTMDGRTLVTGRERMLRYKDLMTGEIQTCDFIREQGIASGVLLREGKTFQKLKREQCYFELKISDGRGNYVLFERR